MRHDLGGHPLPPDLLQQWGGFIAVHAGLDQPRRTHPRLLRRTPSSAAAPPGTPAGSSLRGGRLPQRLVRPRTKLAEPTARRLGPPPPAPHCNDSASPLDE